MPRCVTGCPRHCPALHEPATPPEVFKFWIRNPLPSYSSCHPHSKAPNQPKGILPCPGARLGSDSKVAWHCNSLDYNSSGTHYATWHQPLTWLQSSGVPGEVRVGSGPTTPVSRESNFSSQGLAFTVLAANAPQEILQNKRGMEGCGVVRLRTPPLPSSTPFPLYPLRNRTTAASGESSCSSCSVASICLQEDEQPPPHALGPTFPTSCPTKYNSKGCEELRLEPASIYSHLRLPGAWGHKAFSTFIRLPRG